MLPTLRTQHLSADLVNCQGSAQILNLSHSVTENKLHHLLSYNNFLLKMLKSVTWTSCLRLVQFIYVHICKLVV